MTVDKFTPAILGAAFDSFRLRLECLGVNPPQTLVIEGGSETTRLEAAIYWGLINNCATALEQGAKAQAPCLACPVCRQFYANESVDLRIYDGRISNRQDEENPGSIRALNMDNVRELKSALGIRPHAAKKRVICLQGLSLTREEALNGLLKTLEEPASYNLFILLTPQRDQLLPTLVSRSYCLTLPWLDESCLGSASLANDFAQFLRTGKGFLEKIGGKGAFDAQMAQELIADCQKALKDIFGKDDKCKKISELISAFKPLAKKSESYLLISRWLGEANEMILGTVSPARVFESLAAKIYNLLRSMK